MKSETQATAIKVAAVAASATRWIGALAASEGLYIPVEWLDWWRVVSFVMAAAMAVVEAMAFSYGLRAWRYMRPDSPQARRMMGLIVLAAVTFVAVMTPSIVAYVQHVEVGAVLGGAGLWAWGVAVTLSTIVVLGMVGYGQARMSAGDANYAAHMRSDASHDARTRSHECVQCGASFDKSSALAAHVRWTHPQPSKNGKHAEPAEGVEIVGVGN